MPYQFIKSKPRLSFVVLTVLCFGIGVAATQVQANIQDQSEIALNNPHQIPDELNPRFRRLEDRMDSLKQEFKDLLGKTKEELADESETIHSLALKGSAGSPAPIYDYTTGTSN